MYFPMWVDLKGRDAVPETVHHVVCYVDPTADTSWHSPTRRVKVRRRGILTLNPLSTTFVVFIVFPSIHSSNLTYLFNPLQTDGVHAKDNTKPGSRSSGEGSMNT